MNQSHLLKRKRKKKHFQFFYAIKCVADSNCVTENPSAPDAINYNNLFGVMACDDFFDVSFLIHEV